MVYRMVFNQTAYFGRGAIKEIPTAAKAHGFRKAFIVTDPILLKTGTVTKVTDVLDDAGIPYEIFDNVKPNPPAECIKDGVEKFTGEKYRDIADAFGVADAYSGDLETVREEAVQAVRDLTRTLHNPTTISEVGATKDDLEPLAHDAFRDVCTPGNPRKATEEDILKIYTSLM